MNEYNKLKKEFERKVKELQERCEHKETFWAEQWWALGHGTGYAVKVCNNCFKTLEKIKLKEAYKKGYLKRNEKHSIKEN